MTIFNYKVATNVPVTHSICIRLKEATERIQTETNGQLNIRVFPDGRLGSDIDLVRQVLSGAIDLATLPGLVLGNLIPIASLNSVGFVFSDYPEVWRAMDGHLGKYIRSHIAKTGLIVFDRVWDNGFRHVTSRIPIRTAQDLVDLKIRVPMSPLLFSLFKSLKAVPVPINFNELYTSLQTKVVEAQENPLPMIAEGKLYEVQKWCALTNHAWDGYWLIGNRRAFDALPAPLLETVSRNFDAAALTQRADSEALAASLQNVLAPMGTTAAGPFRATLKEAGFYTEWRTKFGDEAWTKLEAAVGELA
jgi:TRAP-type transport system periplasmic protein